MKIFFANKTVRRGGHSGSEIIKGVIIFIMVFFCSGYFVWKDDFSLSLYDALAAGVARFVGFVIWNRVTLAGLGIATLFTGGVLGLNGYYDMASPMVAIGTVLFTNMLMDSFSLRLQLKAEKPGQTPKV